MFKLFGLILIFLISCAIKEVTLEDYLELEEGDPERKVIVRKLTEKIINRAHKLDLISLSVEDIKREVEDIRKHIKVLSEEVEEINKAEEILKEKSRKTLSFACESRNLEILYKLEKLKDTLDVNERKLSECKLVSLYHQFIKELSFSEDVKALKERFNSIIKTAEEYISLTGDKEKPKEIFKGLFKKLADEVSALLSNPDISGLPRALFIIESMVEIERFSEERGLGLRFEYRTSLADLLNFTVESLRKNLSCIHEEFLKLEEDKKRINKLSEFVERNVELGIPVSRSVVEKTYKLEDCINFVHSFFLSGRKLGLVYEIKLLIKSKENLCRENIKLFISDKKVKQMFNSESCKKSKDGLLLSFSKPVTVFPEREYRAEVVIERRFWFDEKFKGKFILSEKDVLRTAYIKYMKFRDEYIMKDLGKFSLLLIP